MSSIPSVPTLLQATVDHLEQQLLPTLDGYQRFQTRIAVNVLRTVLREQSLGGAQTAAEQVRLAQLLGHDADVQTLRRELAEGIDRGRVAQDAPGLVPHLRQTLAEALAINNPKWIA